MSLHDTAVQWVRRERERQMLADEINRKKAALDNAVIATDAEAALLRKSVGPNTPLRLFDVGNSEVVSVTELSVRLVRVEPKGEGAK